MMSVLQLRNRLRFRYLLEAQFIPVLLDRIQQFLDENERCLYVGQVILRHLLSCDVTQLVGALYENFLVRNKETSLVARWGAIFFPAFSIRPFYYLFGCFPIFFHSFGRSFFYSVI